MAGAPEQAAGMPPPRPRSGVLGWCRARLFATPLNVLLTVLLAWLLLMLVPPLVEWAWIRADFTASSPQQCRAAGGACWARKRRRCRFWGEVRDRPESWNGYVANGSTGAATFLPPAPPASGRGAQKSPSRLREGLGEGMCTCTWESTC